MRLHSLEVLRDGRLALLPVLDVGPARERLAEVVQGLDGGLLRIGINDLCLSIALHRAIAHADDGNWDERPVISVDSDDALIAAAIDELGRAIQLVDDLPVSAIAGVIMRGLRGPIHSPKSRKAAIRLVEGLAAQAPKSASTAVLASFGEALAEGIVDWFATEESQLSDEWPSNLRWHLIEFRTVGAARLSDVEALTRVGCAIRNEIIRFRPLNNRATRRWLAMSASVFRHSEAIELDDIRFQVLDALNLRADEADIAAFIADLDRCPVDPARAEFVRTLWESALVPDESGAGQLLSRIREAFGSTSNYEIRVNALGSRIRSSTLQGFDEAIELLEREVSLLDQAHRSSVPWIRRIAAVPADVGPEATWGPLPVFASVARRVVLLGRALSITTSEPSHGARADAFLKNLQEVVARRGGSVTLLEERHPVWLMEQEMLEVERLIDEKRLDAALDAWFAAAYGTRDCIIAESLRQTLDKVIWLPVGADYRVLVSVIVRLSCAATDEELVELGRDLLSLKDLGRPEDGRLFGLRTPDGEEGGSALSELVDAFDGYTEAEFWRSQMRQQIWRHRPFGQRLECAAPDEIFTWLSDYRWDSTDVIARIMVGLLDDSKDYATVENLRHEGWFEHSTLNLASEVWPQLRSADLQKVLDLRDRAFEILMSVVCASGGRLSPPTRDRRKLTWATIKSISHRLTKDARNKMRPRGYSDVHTDSLPSLLHTAQELRDALIVNSQTDRFIELIVRGNRVIGDLGHPFYFMAVVHALIGDDRPMSAARTIHQLHKDGGGVDLIAVTTVVSALMRQMEAFARGGTASQDLDGHLVTIESLAEILGADGCDARLYSRLIAANMMLGRLERCEELAANARLSGIADSRLELQLLRARVRLAPHSILEAVADADHNGAAQAADLLIVVARALGGEGLLEQGLDWIEAQAHDHGARVELFDSFMAGVAFDEGQQGFTGKRIDVEALRIIHEGMYTGNLPITRASLAAVLGTATRVAMSGTDSDRLVIAQETRRLIAAVEGQGLEHFDQGVIEQLAWLTKWTRSAKLAAETVRLAESIALGWTASRAGRLIEALVFSGDIAIARRLLRAGLAASDSPREELYLYNVFLSMLRGRSSDQERKAIVDEIEARGLELDRFSRAEIGLALAAGRGFEDESRMLRGGAAHKWTELVGPLREGAKLFEPIVARLRLEVRTLSRALESGRPAEQLLERCQNVSDVSRDFAETTQAFQNAVSSDSEGVYSPTRYSITSDIVHELSQPSATLGLQVRELRRAIQSGDIPEAKSIAQDLLVTSQTLGRKLKSYRDSLADADSVAVAETEIEIARAFTRAVETLDPELLGSTRIVGRDSLKRDVKYQRELVVRGNLYLLQRAFFAMLTNSLEAMRRANVDDRIIRVEGLYHPTKLFDGAEHGTIQLFISDTGPGIPQEIADEIFKAGFSTRRQRGLGLGLATVAAIVDLHGGVVQLDSPASARFVIVLPAADLGHGAATHGSIMETDAASDLEYSRSMGLDRSQSESEANMRGTIVKIQQEGDRDVRGGDSEKHHLVRGWVLLEGLNAPIYFATHQSDLTVGVQVEMSVRQTRSGPIGEDLVVRDLVPRGQQVVGVVRKVPERGRPYGFIYVPERKEQSAFFADTPQADEQIRVGDAVSALLVPSFNWSRNAVALQAIQIKRI